MPAQTHTIVSVCLTPFFYLSFYLIVGVYVSVHVR